MRQKCIKNARNTFGGEHFLDDTEKTEAERGLNFCNRKTSRHFERLVSSNLFAHATLDSLCVVVDCAECKSVRITKMEFAGSLGRSPATLASKAAEMSPPVPTA